MSTICIRLLRISLKTFLRLEGTNSIKRKIGDFLTLAKSGLCGIVKSTYGARHFFNGIYSSPKGSFFAEWSKIQKEFASGIVPMQNIVNAHLDKCKILSGDNCVSCWVNDDTKLRNVTYHLGTGDNSVWQREHIAIVEYKRQMKCEKLQIA